MADILIRGIEFPQCCGDCPFQASRWTGDFCSAGQFMMGIDSDYRDKHPNCPLVPLPAGHGRLIDADDLLEKVNSDDTLNLYTVMIADLIREKVSTIIEAEGGGE